MIEMVSILNQWKWIHRYNIFSSIQKWKKFLEATFDFVFSWHGMLSKDHSIYVNGDAIRFVRSFLLYGSAVCTSCDQKLNNFGTLLLELMFKSKYLAQIISTSASSCLRYIYTKSHKFRKSTKTKSISRSIENEWKTMLCQWNFPRRDSRLEFILICQTLALITCNLF